MASGVTSYDTNNNLASDPSLDLLNNVLFQKLVDKQKLSAKNGLKKPSHILRLHLKKLKENLGLFLNLKKVKCSESGKEKNWKSLIIYYFKS